MRDITVELKLPGQIEPDVLAVPFAEGSEALLSAGARILDERLNGRLARLADAGELRPELGKTVLLHTDGELNARHVAIAGVGPLDGLDADAIRTGAAAVAREAEDVGGTIAWLLDETLPLPPGEQAKAVVEGILLGSYKPGRWKTEPDGSREITSIVICTDDHGAADAATRAAQVARWTNWARDLANSPPNELTPAEWAERTASLRLPTLKADALAPAQMNELGMGALTAVGRASANEPRLIVLRHEPTSAQGEVVLGLVGKGITFDAGGISIKPGERMQDMKGDMSGGAAVLAATAAIAELELPIRVVTVVAAAENLVGGESFRPGDILRAANGKTIEITNTDAEGRLVLADALWYARREGATHLLDVATLTGAMELALGDLYGGVFANDVQWRDRIVAAGERSGDHVWPFPLHPRFRRYVDSDYADLKNATELRQASPALAAAFLAEFAGDGPWAHIDMSGPGFFERSRGDYLTQRGGTGYGVRLIVELATALTT
jgi:leucyl aminopeptidase